MSQPDIAFDLDHFTAFDCFIPNSSHTFFIRELSTVPAFLLGRVVLGYVFCLDMLITIPTESRCLS